MRTAARYGIAVASVAAALVATVAFADLVAPMRFLFLWVAVLVTAVTAGAGPAVLAVVLTFAGAFVFVFHPVASLGGIAPIDLIRLLLFTIFAGGISVAVALRRSAEERADALDERLRASERRYRTLVEETPVQQAVWTASPAGEVKWSPEWMKITGQSAEDVAGGGGMSVVHPEDARRTFARWEKALETATPYDDEIRVRIADGGYCWFAVRAVPVRDDENRLTEWVGIMVNINERKRHEEDAAFINRAADVLSSSLGSDETLANLARLCVPELADCCTIHIGDESGFERRVMEHADPAMARAVEEFTAGPPIVNERHPVVKVLRERETKLVDDVTADLLPLMAASEAGLRLVRKLDLRSAVIAPMTARGRTLGALTVAYAGTARRYTPADVPLIEDLARRAAVAIDNARLYEAAEAANRAKDEFLATLSHELRTPLTAITGWAHMLQLGMTDQQTTKIAIDTIVRSAKTQGELIDDLLDLARVVAGTLHLDVKTLDLVSLVQEVTVAARPAVDAKRLLLEFDGSPGSILVRGDERRLRQVVWNLISNAVKFTQTGGRVRISVSADAAMARLDVSDTGRGIDPSFLPHVWDRFRQADSGTSRQYGGLGLGLAVVRHLIELHGGAVHVASEGEGRGATFSFEIPLATASTAEIAAAASDEGETALLGKRVLVVDDEPDARVVLATMLRQFGAEVTAAASAEEAISALGGDSFDVLVTDIAMPGEDGYGLVRRVRATSAIPVIAVSALGTGDDQRRALAAGFTDFVRKPIDPRRLIEAVAASAV